MKKMLKKIFTSIVAFSFLGFLGMDSTQASSSLSGFEAPEAKFVVSVTNDETGETTLLKPILLKSKLNDQIGTYSQSEVEIRSVGYEVFIPLENPTSSEISLFDSAGSKKTEAGVTASINVDYNLRASNTEIQLTKVYGSWSTDEKVYVLSNRTVNAHSGSSLGTSLPTKYPTSNTFSYTTGFGYNKFGNGDGSPRAWSSVKAQVSGMPSSSATISVEVVFPDK
ncbi:hypothetical protein A9986_14115 [Solibacillus silvestris]|nr:hypothetical protein A9986_14115 [Solibacillus silvestris]